MDGHDGTANVSRVVAVGVPLDDHLGGAHGGGEPLRNHRAFDIHRSSFDDRRDQELLLDHDVRSAEDHQSDDHDTGEGEADRSSEGQSEGVHGNLLEVATILTDTMSEKLVDRWKGTYTIYHTYCFCQITLFLFCYIY